MLNSKTPLIAMLCLLLMAGVATADTKVKSRQTVGGQTYENSIYIKGKRQRSENNGGQMITLTQCDLRRNVTIMPQAQAYMIQPYDQPSAATTPNPHPSASATTAPVTKGGVVTSTITTRDTGERKQMFGYTARHLITTMVMDSTPDACSPVKNKMEIDGWYIDAAFALDCEMPMTYRPPRAPGGGGGCRDRYETKQIGTAKRGFPVWEKTTMFGPNGAESFTSLNEVIEFSQAALDQSLFEIPEGYREVQDFASLYAAPSPAMPSASSATPSVSSVSPSAPTTTTSAQAVGPKRAGVIRFGVVAVKTGNVAEGMNASNLALAVQNTFPDKLKGPNVEVVPLDNKPLSELTAEARQKEIDYLIFSTVSHKKGGGGFGSVFGSAAQTVAGNIPYGSTTAAVTTNVAAATVAESIKARDELTLDVRVETPGASYPMLSKQFKGKAKSAGEDIVTPAVTQAAQAILEATRKQ